MKNNKLLILFTLLVSIFFIFSIFFPFKTPVDTENMVSVIGNLKKNQIIEQDLELNLYSVNNIVFRMATYGDLLHDTDFELTLKNSAGDKLEYQRFKIKELGDGSFLKFDFENKRNLIGNYKVILKINRVEKKKNLGIYTCLVNNKHSGYIMKNNSSETESVYYYFNGYEKNYFYTFILMIVSLIFIFISIRKLKIKFLGDKIIFFMLYFFNNFLTFISLIVLLKVRNLGIYEYFIFLLMYVSIILSILFINTLLSNSITKEKLFLLLAIPLGISFMLYVLPFEAPDTQFHYVSAYQNLNLNYNNKKIKLPKVIFDNFYNRNKSYGEYVELMRKDYSYSDLVEFDRNMYNPIEYIFNSIGLFIGKVFNFSPFLAVYFSKFINLLLFLLVGYLIIKNVPIAKNIFLVYMLNPLFIELATSISIDSIINLSSLSFIAYILFLKYSERNIKIIDVIILILLLLFAGVQKICYLPLGLLVFLLFPKFKNINKKMWYFIVASILLLLLIVCHWYFGSGVNSGLSSNSYLITMGSNLINKPLNFIYVLISDLNVHGVNYLSQFFGRVLAWSDLEIPLIVVYLNIIVIVIATLNDSKDIDYELFSLLDRVILIITFVIIFIMIELALYTSWTYIGNNIVNGVQGRYFIPINIIMVLLIGLLCNKFRFSIINNTKIKNYLIFSIVLFENLYAIIYLMNLY